MLGSMGWGPDGSRPNLMFHLLQGIEPEEAPLALGLVMMVKNEADFIVQTLDSLKDVTDHWNVFDTGEPAAAALQWH